MSRYTKRTRAVNNEEMYENIFEDRGVKEIVQFITPSLKFPIEEELKKIRYKTYTWKAGDKFWRLATKQYGDPTLWWVIAQFNKKPTEGHVEPGEVIKVPIELAIALEVLG